MFKTRVSAIGAITMSLAASLALSPVTAAPAGATAKPAASSGWERVALPDLGSATLFSITAPDRDHAWVGGGVNTSSDRNTAVRGDRTGLLRLRTRSPRDSTPCGTNETFSSVVLRWNGAKWTRVTVPDVGGVGSIASASPGNVWAGGECGSLHWDGRSWTATS